ncbi:helix-turn-helix domain-containing protein [Calidifontibacter terrae]
MRPLVVESWRRSEAAGVRPAGVVPLALAADVLQDYRTAHPLWQAMPVIYDVLEQAILDCDAVLAVADEHGQLLFARGNNAALSRAEAIGFAEGACWDERLVGTNAPGTALMIGEPVMVRRDEHFLESVHHWSCAAVPIRDLRTGGVLGAVDVTGGDQIMVPQTMAMLRAAARLAELELLRVGAPAESGAPRVSALGVDSAAFTIGARTLALSPRHSEVLAMLIEHPEGLTGDEIACGLYESESGGSTVRAELLRLRAVLGDDVLGSRPYRLIPTIRADWVQVLDRLETGDVEGALRAYSGPLLPHSTAPAIAELRESVHEAVSAGVRAAGRADLLSTWTRQPWGAQDARAWKALADLLPMTSPLRAVAQAHLHRLW